MKSSRLFVLHPAPWWIVEGRHSAQRTPGVWTKYGVLVDARGGWIVSEADSVAFEALWALYRGIRNRTDLLEQMGQGDSCITREDLDARGFKEVGMVGDNQTLLERGGVEHLDRIIQQLSDDQPIQQHELCMPYISATRTLDRKGWQIRSYCRDLDVATVRELDALLHDGVVVLPAVGRGRGFEV